MPPLYCLDVNSFRLYATSDEAVVSRVEAHLDRLCLSSVTIEEMMTGRISLINRARSGKVAVSVPQAHAGFVSTLAAVQPFPVFTYSDEAERVFQAFSAAIIRIGAQDCRLAAHAIAHGMTVVTRNLSDFEAIGAPCEDWSR